MRYPGKAGMRLLVLFALLVLSLQEATAGCRDATAELEQMAVRRVQLIGPGGTHADLEVRVADSGRERSAGFQHVCPATVQSVSILFLFETPGIPRFHMKNVYMPLDIAFIDNSGVIRSVQTMRPYVIGSLEKKTWSPSVPTVAALEVRAGLLQELGVTEDEWSLTLSP